MPHPLTDTAVGARLDRAPWQRMHTMILLALGAGWLFDSFEVQMFSNAIGPLGDHFHASVFQRDAVLAVWLGGILLGAVTGGRLADRFGRRRLFVATLLWYAGFTVLTGLSPTLTAVYGFRFLAALGVGAEYAIINAAIAEFIPARVRGKANAFVMNFWPAGAIAAALLAFLALDTLALSSAVSWRYMFVLGGLLALVVLFFRRRLPESPRWLVARGRNAEAEQILRSLEPRSGHGPDERIAADAAAADPAPLHARSAFLDLVRHYPGRLILGSLLDLAEAFGYYGLFALLSVVVLPQVHISQAGIPIFYIIGNIGALVGGLLMASLFDRLGHPNGDRVLSAFRGEHRSPRRCHGQRQRRGGNSRVHRRQRLFHRGVNLGLPHVHRAVPHAPARRRGGGMCRDRTNRRHHRHSRPARHRRGARRECLLRSGRRILAGRCRSDGRLRPPRRGRGCPTIPGSTHARPSSISSGPRVLTIPATERRHPMRIAVCGGPYANPYALRAFIADARARGCERLFCLGDLGGFGAEINELWPLLTEAGIECVAGNYDVAIARGDPDCGCGYRDPRDNESAQLIYDHTRAHTSAEFAAWMGQLPTERRLNIGGCDVHLVHGSTMALNDFWWDSLPEAEHVVRVEASGADLIVCTHSGLPWQRRIGTSLVVNVGVLGKPANDGQRNVWYAVLDLDADNVDAELVALAYDWPAQAASMRRAGLPEAFVETIESGWWTTCLEVLPPHERSTGKYHLYRSSLPEGFAPAEDGWGAGPAGPAGPDLPVAPLFGSPYFPPRLWIYTNFHCNLACDYCAVASSPKARARTLSLDRFRDLVVEAVAEEFTELYLTGGEPLLHPDLTAMLTCAVEALPTVLLTNAMLLRGARLQRLRELAAHPNLVLQTSLDGARSQTHDIHRGRGSWVATMAGIEQAVALALPVRVALTETPENTAEIGAVAKLLVDLGVAPEAFAVRPMLRRGLSEQGMDIGEDSTTPELTVTTDGLHWHPAGADAATSPDMLLAAGETPLRVGKQLATERFFTARLADGSMPQPYRCAI